MGHERVGLLPKTRKWREIVVSIGTFGEGGGDIGGIVRRTTEGIRDRLSNMERDPSLTAAFKFLVALSVCSRSVSPRNALREQGIDVPANANPLALAKAVQRWMPTGPPSLEYARMAEGAAVDAVAAWSGRAERPEQNLFRVGDQAFDVWRKASNGAGFCELSRIFFGKFTERYLNYFLEREASSVLPTLDQRERFSEQLSRSIDGISEHAFETARITQSFAAGWFNRHAAHGMPPDTALQGFLRLALAKLREEMRREGQQ